MTTDPSDDDIALVLTEALTEARLWHVVEDSSEYKVSKFVGHPLDEIGRQIADLADKFQPTVA